MKKEWALSQEAFDSLLGWLDGEPEAAGRKYEQIRQRLIKIFACRGCGEADDLADETINRVTAKVGEIIGKYSGDPALYFYGVAQKVHLEYLRSPPVLHPSSPLDSSTRRELVSAEADETIEREYACLESCMQKLPDESRELVLEYYQEEKGAKIDRRKRLASQLGIALNALRIRAHRIRISLQQCVQGCLDQTPAH